jgi:hypothetical protein
MLLRQMLPEHHFSSDTKETVMVAMGFVATMAALILGLLVASAKDSYDKQASGVTEMAAKVVFLDRLLANIGPETKDVRALLRRELETITKRMWPANHSGDSELDPSATQAEELLAGVQSLKTTTDLQNTLKTQAITTSLELGQLRWMEYEQATGATSKALLSILVFWTAVLFASFGIFAPKNGTVIVALFFAALSVTGAIFLIEELNSPFTGMLQIPQTTFVNVANHLGS